MPPITRTMSPKTAGGRGKSIHSFKMVATRNANAKATLKTLSLYRMASARVGSGADFDHPHIAKSISGAVQ